jgi:hypothetical protein
MGITRNKARGRVVRALATALALAALAAVLLAGAGVAAGHAAAGRSPAKPGRPTATAPQGTIATATPTFTWSKARGATKYELRISQHGVQLLETNGLGKNRRSWTSALALPTSVDLTWKIRGRNAAGAGAWSKSAKFKVMPLSSAKAITAFGFATPAATGVINEASHAIGVTVPSGTNVTALVATFTTTGASVAIAGTPQTSGVTANNFSNPVTYTVTAADASTQTYVVTVTVAPPVLAIGDSYQGGLIAYLDGTGQHGLIAAPVNQSEGIRWYGGTNVVTGATGLALGAGYANTAAIIAAQGGTPATYAAGLARAYTAGGYTDWYLPSKDELNRLYALRVLGFGNLGSGSYWSSSEVSATSAWTQIFGDGYQYTALKSTTYKVRAVRTF